MLQRQNKRRKITGKWRFFSHSVRVWVWPTANNSPPPPTYVHTLSSWGPSFVGENFDEIFFYVWTPFLEGVLSWGLSSTRRAWKNICSKFEWNLGGFCLMKNSLRINHWGRFQNLERFVDKRSRKWLNCWKFLTFSGHKIWPVARFSPTYSALQTWSDHSSFAKL